VRIVRFGGVWVGRFVQSSQGSSGLDGLESGVWSVSSSTAVRALFGAERFGGVRCWSGSVC